MSENRKFPYASCPPTGIASPTVAIHTGVVRLLQLMKLLITQSPQFTLGLTLGVVHSVTYLVFKGENRQEFRNSQTNHWGRTPLSQPECPSLSSSLFFFNHQAREHLMCINMWDNCLKKKLFKPVLLKFSHEYISPESWVKSRFCWKRSRVGSDLLQQTRSLWQHCWTSTAFWEKKLGLRGVFTGAGAFRLSGFGFQS